MNLNRQIALVAMPPLFFMVLNAIYASAVGWEGVLVPVAVTAVMAAAGIALSFMVAKAPAQETELLIQNGQIA